MKTYDSERKELYNSILEKRKEYLLAEEKEKPTGMDSNANEQFNLHYQEYIRKLKALRKKYNIE